MTPATVVAVGLKYNACQINALMHCMAVLTACAGRAGGPEQPLLRLPAARAAEARLQRGVQEEDDGDLHRQLVRHRWLRNILQEVQIWSGQEVRG